MPTTIAGQVSRLAETRAAEPPDEFMGAFTREQSNLAAGGRPVGVIEVGARLPDAELLDAHGAPISPQTPDGSPRSPEPAGAADAKGPSSWPRVVPVWHRRPARSISSK